MIIKTQYTALTDYDTKDGSRIRELMYPAVHGNRAQSLAEASLAPGQVTALHRHVRAEELYSILAGSGRMTLGEESFDIGIGDTVCIPAGVAHCLENTGTTVLRLLCCSAPAYNHEDTELLIASDAG